MVINGNGIDCAGAGLHAAGQRGPFKGRACGAGGGEKPDFPLKNEFTVGAQVHQERSHGLAFHIHGQGRGQDIPADKSGNQGQGVNGKFRLGKAKVPGPENGGVRESRHLPQTPFPPQSDRKKMPWRMKFSRRVEPFSARILLSWGKILIRELFFLHGGSFVLSGCLCILNGVGGQFQYFFYPVSGPKPVQSCVTAGPLHRFKVNLRYFVKTPACTVFPFLIQPADFTRIPSAPPSGTGFAI
jgi:hypothetical protein